MLCVGVRAVALLQMALRPQKQTAPNDLSFGAFAGFFPIIAWAEGAAGRPGSSSRAGSTSSTQHRSTPRYVRLGERGEP